MVGFFYINFLLEKNHQIKKPPAFITDGFMTLDLLTANKQITWILIFLFKSYYYAAIELALVANDDYKGALLFLLKSSKSLTSLFRCAII